MTERRPAAPNGFTVDVRNDHGWSVAIVDPGGREVLSRACRDETEARTFASTVRQHIGWLSEERFREVYRLTGGAGGSRSERERASGGPPAGEVA